MGGISGFAKGEAVPNQTLHEDGDVWCAAEIRFVNTTKRGGRALRITRAADLGDVAEAAVGEGRRVVGTRGR